jgi:tetrahydromethanopterin S-methyltransferase subunit G
MMQKLKVVPGTEKLLQEWNDDRLEMIKVQKEIANLEARVKCLRERMDNVPRRLENTLFRLEQPLGMKIGDDYIVVIHADHDDSFHIQVVDFNLREEIKSS